MDVLGEHEKFFIATLIATLLQGTTPAFAASEVSDATFVLQTIVPEIYAQTSDASEVKVSQKTASGEVSVTDLGPGMENSQVSIKMPSELKPSVQADGLTVVDNTDVNFQQVIQPLEVGFRVLNISINGDAPTEYSFELDLPEGAIPELVMGTVRVNRGDEILGSIKEPWAYDGDGNAVETFFTLDGSKVTQHLKTNSNTVYPVVSDPNWGYVSVHNLKGSYLVAWERLHTCFNCYFPVAGAPSKWPSYGQILPLYLDFDLYQEPMECVMNYSVIYATSRRWKFLATKNHLDGYGSTIIFDLRRISSGANQLVVDAFIVNDFILGFANHIYEDNAKANWKKFADNLNRY